MYTNIKRYICPAGSARRQKRFSESPTVPSHISSHLPSSSQPSPSTEAPQPPRRKNVDDLKQPKHHVHYIDTKDHIYRDALAAEQLTSLQDILLTTTGDVIEGGAASPAGQVEGRKAGMQRPRRRRSLSKWKYLQRASEKTMEMLVVVDKTMLQRHGNKNVTTYTLTLFNMVCCDVCARQLYLLSFPPSASSISLFRLFLSLFFFFSFSFLTHLFSRKSS